MANNNRYSGQPTYSKDVCGLMRRINALESLVNFLPLTQFSEVVDFDVYDGRLYCLCWEKETSEPANWVIRIYETATGTFVQKYIVPIERMTAGSSYTLPDEDEVFNAYPRICVGGGFIYMPGAFKRDDQPYGWQDSGRSDYAFFGGHYYRAKSRGAFWRFRLDGTDPEMMHFDEKDFYNYPPSGNNDQDWDAPFRAPGGCGFSEFEYGYGGWFYTNMFYLDQKIGSIGQIHYCDGRIYGIVRGKRAVFESEVSDTLYGVSFLYSPGIERNGLTTNLFCVEGDFSRAFAVVESVEELRSDTNTLGEYNYYSVIPLPSPASTMACCPNGDYLYFDGGGNQIPTASERIIYSPQFVRLLANGTETSTPLNLHQAFSPTISSKGRWNTPLSQFVAKYHAALYATDGTDLFALEYHLGASGGVTTKFRRYTLGSGAFVAEYDMSPVQIRMVDGYLWCAFRYNAGRLAGTSYDVIQSYVDVYDPATMTLVRRIIIGDPMGQTEWFAVSNSSQTSMGTPDSGVAVPDLERLAQSGVIKSPLHITQMRDALVRLAPFFIAPSGNPLHLNGTNDPENLYALAMGTRTNYGATGGTRYSWTRALQDMLENSIVGVEGDGNNYVCIRDHTAQLSNKPGLGVNWRTYWRVFSSSEDTEGRTTLIWTVDTFYGIHKTYDIDIGEIDEVVSLLEYTPTGATP